jgi:hypothetical protein
VRSISHAAWAEARAGNVKSLFDGACNIIDIGDEIIVLGDGIVMPVISTS